MLLVWWWMSWWLLSVVADFRLLLPPPPWSSSSSLSSLSVLFELPLLGALVDRGVGVAAVPCWLAVVVGGEVELWATSQRWVRWVVDDLLLVCCESLRVKCFLPWSLLLLFVNGDCRCRQLP